jgi:hypothetical protein
MAIIQTVNFSMFCDMFTRMGRQDQFSYEAKQALFDYLESYSDDRGESVDLDIIAICCDYTESTAEEMNEDYSLLIEKEEDEDDEKFQERLNEEVGEFIEKNSTLIMSKSGNFVYQQF